MYEVSYNGRTSFIMRAIISTDVFDRKEFYAERHLLVIGRTWS